MEEFVKACGALLTDHVCWEDSEQVQLKLYYGGSIHTEEDRDEVNTALIPQTTSALLVSQNATTAHNSSQQCDLMLAFYPFNAEIC